MDCIGSFLSREQSHNTIYLDDFLLFGAPGSDECRMALQISVQVCARLGVPIATHKTESLASKLFFFEIELDAEAEIRFNHCCFSLVVFTLMGFSYFSECLIITSLVLVSFW